MEEAVYNKNSVLVEAREALVKVIHAGYSIWDLQEIAEDALEEAVKETLGEALKLQKRVKAGAKIK